MDTNQMLVRQKDENVNLGSRIARIAGLLSSEDYPTGDRAALKRMVPGGNLPLAFYRFAFRYLPDQWETQLNGWVTIVAGIALMWRNSHNPKEPAGRALAIAGYSEKRLERLLIAEGDVLHVLLQRAARFLAAKGKSINWADFARLILSKDAAKLETIRHAIARDYYRNLKSNEE